MNSESWRCCCHTLCALPSSCPCTWQSSHEWLGIQAHLCSLLRRSSASWATFCISCSSSFRSMSPTLRLCRKACCSCASLRMTPRASSSIFRVMLLRARTNANRESGCHDDTVQLVRRLHSALLGMPRMHAATWMGKKAQSRGLGMHTMSAYDAVGQVLTISVGLIAVQGAPL